MNPQGRQEEYSSYHHSEGEEENENIIDLSQFDHSPKTTALSSTPSAVVPEPSESITAGLMRRIFTVVPPSPPSSPALSSATTSLVSQGKAKARDQIHRPSGSLSSHVASKPPTTNGTEAAALNGLKNSLDLGLGGWWSGKGKASTTNDDEMEKFTEEPDEYLTLFDERDVIRPVPQAVSSMDGANLDASSSQGSLYDGFPSFHHHLTQERSTSPDVSSRLSEALSSTLDVPSSSAPASVLSYPPQAHIAPPSPSSSRTKSLFSSRQPGRSGPFHAVHRGPSPVPFLHQRSGSVSSLESLRELQRKQSVQEQQARAFGVSVPSALSASGLGWWRENKTMVDGMLSDEDKGSTVEEEEANIARKYRAPKNPIVFCHGLFGFDLIGPASMPTLQISHWRGIREVLEANGAEVFIGRVPATSSIEERANILKEEIEKKFEGREVNLVGHSMGGLDCRYLASKLKPMKFKVLSVTTVATPHRGSAFADYMIDQVIGRAYLPSVLSVMDVLRLPNQGDGRAFDALGTMSMSKFNIDVRDDPDVMYASWGARFDPSYFNTFKWPHSVIFRKEGPNDGLVSVRSAQWGEYMGTLENVNHLDLVGWVNQVRYTLSEWMGQPIKFKPASFYLELGDMLAKRGF